jgi:exodeoxyribonuclease VII large subunit
LRLDKLAQRLESREREEIERRAQQIRALQQRLATAHPRAVLHRLGKNVGQLEEKLKVLARRALAGRRHRFEGLAGRLDALSPLRVLARGYSVAFDSRGHALKDAAQADPGDRIRIRLHEGELQAEVLSSARKGE